MPGFTHLHTVSGFSLRHGASHPERLAERAFERGMDALALTDRDTLAGTVRFAKACARAGVRPLFGVNLAVAPAATASEAGPAHQDRRRRTPVRGGAFIDESTPRVTYLARDGARGWADLCRLVTAAHRHPDTPVLTWGDNHADGLTVLLWPGSDVGRALAAGRPDRAARLLAPAEAYGDDLRLEAGPARPYRHRPRLAAAGRPDRRLRRRAGRPPGAEQRGAVRGPRPGPGRRRAGRRTPPGPDRPGQAGLR
ncbi:Error-prone DNA polymerase [Streptomyces glaucescens]